MASDIRDGLWTFFEDIRQATIGEEATMSPSNTKSAPKPLKRSNTTGTATSRNARTGGSSTTNAARKSARHDTLIDIGGSFWREHGVETPASKRIAKPTKQTALKKDASPLPSSTDLDEPWDTWDTPIKTPPAHHESSSDTSDEPDSHADSASDDTGTPLTDDRSRPTPRTSTSSKRNSIPWPDLENLTPNNLKRTASHLMKEWEKSLTPSPSEPDVDFNTPFSSGAKQDKSD
jgi:hypothetical protein